MTGRTQSINFSPCSCNGVQRRAATRNSASAPRRLRRRELINTRQWNCQTAFAVANSDDPLTLAESDKSSPAAIQKYLASVGWESAWIDGVIERVMKKQLVTTSDQCQAVVEYLMSVGLSEHQVCNMVSLCHDILTADPYDLEGVVAFLKGKGVRDISGTLALHPKLLVYKVRSDRKVLEKGQMRTAVAVRSPGGVDDVRVVIFREGATFNTSPVTPWKPDDI